VFISPPALSPREYVAAMAELAKAGPPNPEELAALSGKHDTYTPSALNPDELSRLPRFRAK
jgi:hypothetical protein